MAVLVNPNAPLRIQKLTIENCNGLLDHYSVKSNQY